MQEISPGEAEDSARWLLIRDAAVLQVKLIADGLRDFLLVPASLIALVLSLVTGSDGKPGPQFYRLLAMGKRSERWINLFGAYKATPDDAMQRDPFAQNSIDELVGRVEAFVVDEYKRGGMTGNAKQRIDQALNVIQRQGKKGNDS